MLLNKAGIWKSTNEWNFVTDDNGRVYIEIASDDNNVLGIKGDEVIPEVKDPVKTGQLWIKGEEKAGGYFTLKNSEFLKVLTAISASGLKIKGNTNTFHSQCIYNPRIPICKVHFKSRLYLTILDYFHFIIAI